MSAGGVPAPPRTLLEEILVDEPLSARELELLAHLAAGDTALESGARVFLSVETVKSYRKRIIAKLGARNGTHAAVIAVRRGLI